MVYQYGLCEVTCKPSAQLMLSATYVHQQVQVTFSGLLRNAKCQGDLAQTILYNFSYLIEKTKLAIPERKEDGESLDLKVIAGYLYSFASKAVNGQQVSSTGQRLVGEEMLHFVKHTQYFTRT